MGIHASRASRLDMKYSSTLSGECPLMRVDSLNAARRARWALEHAPPACGPPLTRDNGFSSQKGPCGTRAPFVSGFEPQSGGPFSWPRH